MQNSNSKWSGKLEIYPESCCEICNETIHNHFDCPLCGEKRASTDIYGSLIEMGSGDCVIECKCKAKFYTKAVNPYDSNTIWEQVS